MSRFDDFHRMIASMMADFGFSASYVSVGEPVANDADGTVSSPETIIPVQAIVQELPRPNQGVTNNTGSLIQEGDQQLYIRPTEQVDILAAAILVNPTRDYVIINNVRWKVVVMKQHNPAANENILYELYIRK